MSRLRRRSAPAFLRAPGGRHLRRSRRGVGPSSPATVCSKAMALALYSWREVEILANEEPVIGERIADPQIRSAHRMSGSKAATIRSHLDRPRSHSSTELCAAATGFSPCLPLLWRVKSRHVHESD